MPLLPQISVSVKAAVLRDDHVLLLSYDDASGFHYNLPGGKAREGECLRDAVRRKVAEETGLRVRTDRLLFVVEYVPEVWRGEFGDVQKVQFNFLAEPLDDTAPRMSDPADPDQIGFEWVPMTSLASKQLLPRVVPQLLDALGGDRSDCLVDRW
ncbi:NUDIX domain-containing protein [Micromonospora sp. NPDC050276]|uniref:NUDIX domain-containing protein n=1 Tax=Micromonospora sp. NPDC050276 TaxID=3364278 RepID=UPI0037AAD2A2